MDFNLIWEILENRGRVAHFYQSECEYLWSTLSPEQQQAVHDAITKKIASGRFVSFRPQEAIRDNIPKKRGPQSLSFADYYAKFGTTEEQGGWTRKFLPDEQRTVYVKG